MRIDGPIRHRSRIVTVAPPPAPASHKHAQVAALGTLLLTAAGTIAAATVLATAHGLDHEASGALWAALLTLVPYGLAGAFLISRRPDLPFGWLLACAASALVVCLATAGPALKAISDGNTSTLALLGLSMSSLGFVPIAVQGLINVRFPSGTPVTRWERALDKVLIGGLVLVVLGGFLGKSNVPDFAKHAADVDVQNPITGTSWVADVFDAFVFAAPIVVLLGLVAGIGVVVRWRRAEGLERQQLKWRAVGILTSFTLFPLAVSERLPEVVSGLDGWLFVSTLAIPVVRYRLWAIDTILRRSAVYAVVTVVLAAAYVAIAAAGAALAGDAVGYTTAAVVVALTFTPVRNRSQHAVDRLFYGERSDPYRALSDVGRRLETVAAPGEVLPTVVTAVADTLRLPYVALERDGTVLAAAGEGTATESWPLTYQGVTVGALAARPRRGESTFDERDRKVLADLARQAGAAVHAEALTADLLDSRQRLVTAREEERRRLRRDLHDGLGPMLTGLGLNLDAARARVTDPDAELYLAQAKDASSQAIADLRGMVYGLRPPALDDLGLLGAVQIHADRLGTELQVDIDAAELPSLSAAVEVAVFRTAVEALSNVVRHSAGARRCHLTLTAGRDLVLVVTDDGACREPWSPGVGLVAMRERALELGGTLTAGPTAQGGRVVARYPLVSA